MTRVTASTGWRDVSLWKAHRVTATPKAGMHAFVDESSRPGVYLMAAAIVDPAELRRLRTAMRGLLLPGQRELYMQKERDQRRGVLVDQVVATGVLVRI